MYLDAVEKIVDFNEGLDFDAFAPPAAAAAVREAALSDPVFEKWLHFPISKFSHHGRACCEIAREWLFAMDFSQLNGESIYSGPRWIRQRFNWGPTHWQIHWCEAVERKSLDCGAQAALAHEVFIIRGVRSYPVQLVQQYSKDATSQWSKRWLVEDTSLHWINEDLIYHEGCAVLTSTEEEIKIWDASAGWWINPQHYTGYGSLRAIKLIAPAGYNSPQSFVWGNHRIIPNRWQKIEERAKEFYGQLGQALI